MSVHKNYWDQEQMKRIEGGYSASKKRHNTIIRYIEKNSAVLKSEVNILNIGIGNGYLEETLLDNGYSVSCLDPSETAIEAITGKLGLSEENACVGSIDKLPFKSNSFDYVVVSEVLEHLDEDVLVSGIKEIQRVLCVGGIFIGTVPCNEDLSRETFSCPVCMQSFHRVGHMRSYTPKTLRNLLEQFFSVNTCRMFLGMHLNWKGLLLHYWNDFPFKIIRLFYTNVRAPHQIEFNILFIVKNGEERTYIPVRSKKWWSSLSRKYYFFNRFIDFIFSLSMICRKKDSYGFLRMNKKPDVALFNYKGIKFSARKRDWLAVREVLIDDEYFFIENIIGDDERCCVLDLGGNIGCFAIKVLSHNCRANIVSVEASPATFQILSDNVSRQKELNWKALEYAVWRNGEKVYLDCVDEPLSTQITSKLKEIQCHAISLTALVEEYCDEMPRLIKMDIEGAETVVLPDSIELLNKVPYLIVEFHGNNEFDRQIILQLNSIYPYCWSFNEKGSKNRLYCFLKNKVGYCKLDSHEGVK